MAEKRDKPSSKTKSGGQRRNHTEKTGLQRVLTILTVISLVVGIPVASLAAFNYWQSSQQNQKSELLQSLRYSKSILPSCNMTEEDRQRIERSIDEAINEVELYNDIPTAQSIFDTVKGQLSNCPVPTTAVYSLSSLLVLTVVLLAIGLVLLAVRARKKVPYV